MRRYPTAPIAQEMPALVAELYIAEHAADAKAWLERSELELRKERAGPIDERMRVAHGAERTASSAESHRRDHPLCSEPVGRNAAYRAKRLFLGIIDGKEAGE